MRKKLMAFAMTGVLCAGMVFPAMAAGDGVLTVMSDTEVFAGVTLDDNDTKIKVEVPTLFAFVVNGTTDTTTQGGVSSIDGTILLPNYKVVNAQGELQIEGQANNWKFTNYSTQKGTEAENRKGVKVEVNGAIRNEGSAADRNGWEHVANADTLTGEDGYKKYTLAVNDIKFSSAKENGFLGMENWISVEKPDLVTGGVDTTTGYAKVGATTDTDFNVYVGGKRNQYKDVEASAKVGSIIWTVRLATN